jgi:hypothetical protein
LISILYLIKRLSSTILSEPTAIGEVYIKIVQELIDMEFKKKQPQMGAPEQNRMLIESVPELTFKSFYAALKKKAEGLKSLDKSATFLKEFSENPANIDSNIQATLLARVPLIHSMSVYSEIIAHFMMVLEFNFLDSEGFFNLATEFLLEIIKSLKQINFPVIKKEMPAEHFGELLSAVSKIMHLISKIHSRLKQTPQDPINAGRRPQSDNFERLFRLVGDHTDRMKNIVEVLAEITKVINISNYKQILDCYGNIWNYVSTHPDYFVTHFDVFFSPNRLFRENTLTWSPTQLLHLSVTYTNSMRLLQNSKTELGGLYFSDRLKFQHISTHIDNLFYILFDQRINSNTFLKTVEDLKIVVDFLKKDFDEGQGKLTAEFYTNPTDAKQKFGAFLARIVQKLIHLIKIHKDYVKEFVTFYKAKNLANYPERGPKYIDEVLIKEMPRYEECATPDILQEKTVKFIDYAQKFLNDNAALHSQNTTNIRTNSLLEEKEGFVFRTCVLNATPKYSVPQFAEDNLFKTYTVLNDFASRLLLDLISLDAKTISRAYHDTIYQGQPTQRLTLTLQVLSDRDYGFVKKLFKYNLEIYLNLMEEHTLIKDKHEQFKFNTSLFERKEPEVKLDMRQLYGLIEENIELVYSILKSIIKAYDNNPSVGQMNLCWFLDGFFGTDMSSHIGPPAPTQPGNNRAAEKAPMVGYYTFGVLTDIIIKSSMRMFNELPDKMDNFHFLYDKEINTHWFLIKVLRFFFRSLKSKELTKQYTDLIIYLKKTIFKFIMFILKMTITQNYPLDYLSLFRAVIKSLSQVDYFNKYLTGELKEKNIRILDFFIHMFKTNIEELKVMATELILTLPIDLISFVSKYTEVAKDFLGLLTYGLTLNPLTLVINAFKVLDHITASSNLLKEEVLQILEPHSEALFNNLFSLMTQSTQKSYFLSNPTPNQDVPLMYTTLKSLAKLSLLSRNVQLPIEFKVNDDEILNLCRGSLSQPRGKILEPTAACEDAMIPEAEEITVPSHVLEIDIEESSTGKKFSFNTEQTLATIFKNIQVFKTKQYYWGVYMMSDNMNFISTSKKQLGLEKLNDYLRKLFYVMAFSANEEVEYFFDEKQRLLARNTEGEEPHPTKLQFENLSDGWRAIMKVISLKPIHDKFTLQKITEGTFYISSLMVNGMSEEAAEALCTSLKDAVFALTKATFDKQNAKHTFLRRNFILIFQSIHCSVMHQ